MSDEEITQMAPGLVQALLHKRKTKSKVGAVAAQLRTKHLRSANMDSKDKTRTRSHGRKNRNLRASSCFRTSNP